MAVNTASAREYLRTFDFPALFIEELGWDRLQITPLAIDVEGESYRLHPVAEKRGVQIFRYEPEADGLIPPHLTRQKIDRAVAKLAYEHLIIYADASHTTQIWQWVKREPGRPAAYRGHTYHQGQSGEALLQKLDRITFAISDEEHLTLSGVTLGMRDAFDKDRVTKRFYDRFKDEHQAFHNFISGITGEGDQDWYASIMLNRLMFVYFIQKKGFLDNDPDYLQTRLKAMQSRPGDGTFHSFYRYFLLQLFHQGLGARKDERSPELDELLGDVPYLNGGLFDVHALEEDNPDLQIPDAAFVKLFAFFDEYTWHLDDRPLAAGNEINPDVLGYIFEKYINQKQMGAYYTKEDITGYISRNTILPWILDQAREDCTNAFRPEEDGNVWRLLRDDPDTYIYAAVKQGVIDDQGEIIPLPAEIAAGLDDVTLRGGWNRAAPDPYALPTETWREHVARRQRCLDLRQKLRDGEVHTADDLITYNLDIVQFTQDVIETSEGPELLRAMYKAIRSVSVLDPTCGSGAFLFAALNILDPLHDACLDRMQAFVTDLDQSGADHSPEKSSDFRKALAELERHPSQGYFVLKQIVLNNLYGVDIMAEAVEICKLRLFLKLVAQLDDKSQIEPLPDIDFNIRAGNTLVGFATRAEVERSLTMAGPRQVRMLLDDDRVTLARIEEQLDKADLDFERFRDIQQQEDDKGGQSLADAKVEYRDRLRALNDELDRYQASLYGINPDWPKTVAAWKESHQPFHWFVDFHGIMSDGGFDVIVGNPPYVEYGLVQCNYTIKGYHTKECGNLYAFVMERSLHTMKTRGRLGLIVPISLTAAQRMQPLQEMILSENSSVHLSNFALRPAALFPGVMQRLTICLLQKGRRGSAFTTDYMTWYAEERSVLFESISYLPLINLRQAYSIPKVNNPNGQSAITRILSDGRHWHSHRELMGNHHIFYHNAGGYWIKTFDFRPFYRSNSSPQKRHTTISELSLPSSGLAITYLGILNSSTFYFFWKSLTDARHVYPSDIAMLPISLPLPGPLINKLSDLCQQLMDGYKANSKRITYGKAQVDQFDVGPSKPIIDEIDRVLAEHYGFTDEELDFIINYDIKYRMGRGAEDGEE